MGAQYLFFLGRPDVNIREYQMTLFATYVDDVMDAYEGKSQTMVLDQVKKLIATSKNGDLQ